MYVYIHTFQIHVYMDISVRKPTSRGIKEKYIGQDKQRVPYVYKWVYYPYEILLS